MTDIMKLHDAAVAAALGTAARSLGDRDQKTRAALQVAIETLLAENNRLKADASLVEQRLIAKLLEGVGEPIASEESDIATSEIARVMREYNYPANPSNAARVGWRACRQHTAEQVAAAVLAERERCAKVCEDKAWLLKEVAIKANSGATNSRAIAWADAADTIRGATT